MSALAETCELVVEYHGRAGRLRALDGVSVAIGAGEAVGVVGESGSGKTTLARALVGLVRPASGRVALAGQDLARLPRAELVRRRRELAIVFQNPASSFDPRLPVGESIAEPLAVREPGLTRAAREARVGAMLARVGLDAAHARARPHELSGGQCQRAAIARAMITAPALLVCDEATSALDVSVQAQIVNLLAALRAEQGTAFLIISHNLAVVRRLADRVLVLYRGRLVEAAPRDRLFGAPRHPYTRLLIDAVPSLGASRHDAARLPPDTASPFVRPAGCAFAARCPHALDRCHATVPALEAAGPGHEVACLRWREFGVGPR